MIELRIIVISIEWLKRQRFKKQPTVLTFDMRKVKSLEFILAGGPGTRLFPLTRDRAKPAAPYGAKYRIIDLALNNHVNSGSRNIIVVAQYRPASLIRHIKGAWAPEFKKAGREFIQIVQPERAEYKGTANAVYENMGLINDSKPSIVTVFCGDHIYLMDISKMKQYHLDNLADLTIAAIPVRREMAAKNFGVLVANEKGDVLEFQEKPANPAPIPGMEDYCWASMGNYVFNRSILVKALQEDAKKERVSDENKELVLANPDIYTLNDFGFNIIPAMRRQGKRIRLYDFQTNKPDEIVVTGYWRDVGSLDQFIESNMDLTGPNPRFVVDNPGWPVVTVDESNGKGIIGSEYARDSVLANGVEIDKKARLERCIISYNTLIGERSEISDSILMGHTTIGKNVRLKRAIVDRGILMPDKMRIGVFHDEDKARGFTISPGGYVIVPRNYQFK